MTKTAVITGASSGTEAPIRLVGMKSKLSKD